jgi:mRNA-degrading endonuclease RelE of RelBE toxin-antitoxin system
VVYELLGKERFVVIHSVGHRSTIYKRK